MANFKRFTTQLISQKRFTLTVFGFAITTTWNLLMRIPTVAMTIVMQLLENIVLTVRVPTVVMTIVTRLQMSFTNTIRIPKVAIVALMRQIMSFTLTMNIVRPVITATMHLIWKFATPSDPVTIKIPKVAILANVVVATFRLLRGDDTNSICGTDNLKVLEDWSSTDLITMSYTIS